jgi:hypothetical protein
MPAVGRNSNFLGALLNERDTAHARTISWGLLILVLLTGAISVAYRAKRSLNPVEYEGRIIEKWAGYHHSEEGSTPYFRLLLETESGQRLTVTIDQQIYERAKVGMQIRKSAKGIDLSLVEPVKGAISEWAWAVG